MENKFVRIPEIEGKTAFEAREILHNRVDEHYLDAFTRPRTFLSLATTVIGTAATVDGFARAIGRPFIISTYTESDAALYEICAGLAVMMSGMYFFHQNYGSARQLAHRIIDKYVRD